MQAKKFEVKGTHEFGGNSVEFHMPLIEFKEGDIFILFAPALDISGYGKTEEEAQHSFEVVFEEFIEYTVKKHTLHKELKRLGWKIKSVKSETIKVPTLDRLMEKNPTLKELFSKDKALSVTYPAFSMPLYA